MEEERQKDKEGRERGGKWRRSGTEKEKVKGRKQIALGGGSGISRGRATSLKSFTGRPGLAPVSGGQVEPEINGIADNPLCAGSRLHVRVRQPRYGIILSFGSCLLPPPSPSTLSPSLLLLPPTLSPSFPFPLLSLPLSSFLLASPPFPYPISPSLPPFPPCPLHHPTGLQSGC